MQNPSFHKREENRGRQLADYWPLVVLILISSCAGCALSFSGTAGVMHYFMGFFLCSFAMLKLFHPFAFADGFQMYDLLAKQNRAYAYAYPLIELMLGLGYLSFIVPALVYLLTIALFGFGAAGVVQALRRGLDINCPCMGTILSVPLSTVTLFEDIVMAAMAFMMLVSSF